MAITRVQYTGTTCDSTPFACAYTSNVTAGNLLVIMINRWSQTTSDPPVVGDISMSEGTATLGSFTLDKVQSQTTADSNYIHAAVFSVPVTGTGSCTVSVAANTGDLGTIAIVEYSGIDVSAGRVDGTNGAGTLSNAAPHTGDVTSTAGAVFCAVCSLYTGDNAAVTQDAAFTLIYEEEDGTAHQVGSAIDRIVTSSTTDEGSWTEPAKPNAAALAVYKAGPAYTVTKSEGVTLGESNAVQIADALAASKSEGVTLGEAVTVSVVGTGEINVTDNIGVGEAVTVTLPDALSINASDGITLGESSTAAFDALPALEINKTDSIFVSDARFIGWSDYEINVSDGVTLGESNTQALDDMAISQVEGVTLGESVTIAIADDLAISKSEGLTLGEAATVQVEAEGEYYVNVSDGVTVGDGGAIAIGDLGIAIDPAYLIYWTAGVEVV